MTKHIQGLVGRTPNIEYENSPETAVSAFFLKVQLKT